MNDKAFDAVESYLSEADRDPSEGWRTVSLVTGLLLLISRSLEFERPALEGRRSKIIAIATELTRRGLDALSLIRYGMYREVTAPIVAAVLIKGPFGENESVDGVDADAWCSVLGIDAFLSDSGEPSTQQIATWFLGNLAPAIPRLGRWLVGASLDHIISLTPPPGGLAAELAEIPGEREIRSQYRWMVDHFAQTYYRDWHSESLHYELRWTDGDILAPCPDVLMHDRKVSKQKLVEEIAHRAVYGTGKPDAGASVVAEMTRHARSLLRQGRNQDAAAVFEFGVQQRPDDAEIRNNLGFCLIPVDPGRALEHLKTAANMGYHSSVTNGYNQMCCYFSLGRPIAALNLADSEWGKSRDVETAMIWKLSADGCWELGDSNDVVRSIAEFAADIAHIEGKREQEEIWRANATSRLVAVGSPDLHRPGD